VIYAPFAKAREPSFFQLWSVCAKRIQTLDLAT